MKISENELLEVLRKAKPPVAGGDGMRVEDIHTETGMGTKRIRDTIRAAIAAGTVRRTTRRIEGLHGMMMVVPSYAIVAKKSLDASPKKKPR